MAIEHPLLPPHEPCSGRHDPHWGTACIAGVFQHCANVFLPSFSRGSRFIFYLEIDKCQNNRKLCVKHRHRWIGYSFHVRGVRTEDLVLLLWHHELSWIIIVSLGMVPFTHALWTLKKWLCHPVTARQPSLHPLTCASAKVKNRLERLVKKKAPKRGEKE